jgi:hypothetical protein
MNIPTGIFILRVEITTSVVPLTEMHKQGVMAMMVQEQ